MNRELVEKFFFNQATREETECVLDWFDTFEGKKYLLGRLELDYGLMDRGELRELILELDSEQMYQSILTCILQNHKDIVGHKRDWFAYTFKAAAAILVLFLTSFFYVWYSINPADNVVKQEPIHFQTNDDQHREITLSDGSEIRLNSNSEIIISPDFMHGTREIELIGEAFFDVVHDPQQPFIIHANHSTVRVLGTSFNIRSLPGQSNVQVSVLDGRVSFTNKKAVDKETNNENGVVLTKGQYAYMDIQKSTFQVDDVAVENYLSWKSGKFVFEELPLQQVCLQLNRLYETQCNFNGLEIKDLPLTANFSNESLEKTLSVIALSLKIEFEKNEENITWSKKG